MDLRRQTIPAKRFGTADEFGAICAFLCSLLSTAVFNLKRKEKQWI
jgi:NAD(P)-dependent dehydrogenase (short-subunit alcohol dehydrogenase family)